MVIAEFLGWSGDEWSDTLGLVIVFFVAFPLLAHGLIGFAVAQGFGEKQENDKLRGKWGPRPDDPDTP